MEKKVNPVPEKFRRERKMLLMLPVIVVPLLCLAFYGLDGGKGGTKHSKESSGKGLNMALPEARFDPKKKALNKLGVYKQADQDSVRLLERRKLDPYYKNGVGESSQKEPTSLPGGVRGRWDTGWNAGGVNVAHSGGLESRTGGPEEKADELLQKLEMLKGVLSRQGVPDKPGLSAIAGSAGMSSSPQSPAGINSGRPELGGVGNAGALPGGTPRLPAIGRGDPDLDKLGGMLDKILRIQHPDDGRVADTVGPAGQASAVAELTGPKMEEAVKMLVEQENIPGPGRGQDSVEQIPGTGFLNLDDNEGGDHAPGNLIEAVVARDQTLISGESVEFRLSEEALINDVRIPSGTLITGKASLSGERLLVAVSVIRVGKLSVPVSLEVLDLDGIAGIKEKGSINRDVSKQSADEAINTMGVTAFDPSLGGQAAAAGLQAAKTLLSRKIRLVRVSLKAGYRVLLKNTKNNR